MSFHNHEFYIERCYELAIDSGKRGFDTFGALVVHNGVILEEAGNTADYETGIFGHAEFNVVQKCANRYPDSVLSESVLYTSCAPCTRCMMAIASLGIRKIVYGVSYPSFGLLLPFEPKIIDYPSALRLMDVEMEMTGPVLEDKGMRVFEYWGGEYRPLEELLRESAEMKMGSSKEAAT